MRIRKPLFLWLMRESLSAHVFALVTWVGFVLLLRETLEEGLAWSLLIICAHCGYLTRFREGNQRSDLSYLYSQGFSRDTLWAHHLLVETTSVLIALVPASLLVLLGFRSSFQDHLFENPYYPILSAYDRSVVPLWWFVYAVALP